mmetsp:Transcript_7882/g.17562  ORF Transcript_7882/g.17562 Transcript_7882/m.17562 type:complete len:121 (+) Transcript_7882:2088-2450(+)
MHAIASLAPTNMKQLERTINDYRRRSSRSTPKRALYRVLLMQLSLMARGRAKVKTNPWVLLPYVLSLIRAVGGDASEEGGEQSFEGGECETKKKFRCPQRECFEVEAVCSLFAQPRARRA